MESPNKQPIPESKTEVRYSIQLRTPLFSYLVENLRPAYQQELDKIKLDGSMNKLREFYDSKMGRIMGNMLDQFTNPNELPSTPVLSLSSEDVKFLKDKIEAPTDAAGIFTRQEMMSELENKVSTAKLNSRISKVSAKFRSLFKRT